MSRLIKNELQVGVTVRTPGGSVAISGSLFISACRFTRAGRTRRRASPLENFKMESERRLKMELIGTGRNIVVVAKGKCRDFPCRVDGWRCPVCTRAMSEAYQGVITEQFDSYQNDIEELKTRKKQVINSRSQHLVIM
jgi:hypothetical protein